MATTIESLEARVAALEAKVETKVETAIAKAVIAVKARAPSIVKAAVTVAAGYAAAKFDVVSLILKHIV